MHETSKYSELITAIGVIFMVVFSSGEYDEWDIYLGFVGLFLGYFYFQNMKNYNFFYHFLTFSLISVSFTILLFSVCGTLKKEDNKLVTYLMIEDTPIKESYIFFPLVVILWALYWFSIHSPTQNEN